MRRRQQLRFSSPLSPPASERSALPLAATKQLMASQSTAGRTPVHAVGRLPACWLSLTLSLSLSLLVQRCGDGCGGGYLPFEGRLGRGAVSEPLHRHLHTPHVRHLNVRVSRAAGDVLRRPRCPRSLSGHKAAVSQPREKKHPFTGVSEWRGTQKRQWKASETLHAGPTPPKVPNGESRR